MGISGQVRESVGDGRMEPGPAVFRKYGFGIFFDTGDEETHFAD